MAQKTMMLNELTQYMIDCDLNFAELKPIDFELLTSFIETMFKCKTKESVKVKFKCKKFLKSKKHGLIFIVENNFIKKDIIVFNKNGTIEIPKSITEKEREIAKTCFMKWCDFLYFENAGGKKA